MTAHMNRPRSMRWFAAGACALVLAGCGSDDSELDEAQVPATDETAEEPEATEEPETTEEPEAAEEPADEGSGTEVRLLDEDGFVFEPVELSVAAGDTVTWVHDGRISHTVTADDDSFGSGTLAAGDTFEVTFDEAGTFPYACDFHGTMRGTITVG